MCKLSPLLVSALILILWTRGNIAESLPWEILDSICNSSDDIDTEYEELVRQAADQNFGSHPVPQPEFEADLASADMASDSYAWTSISLQKLQKNKLVLSMSHVCRNWRGNLISSKRLWRDIAFSADVTVTGVSLATLFLAKVEGDDIPLRIYAGLPLGNLPDPTIVALLSKLCQQTHRWEVFACSGRLNPYRPYLDLPAPRLRHFSDNHDLSHLYHGQTHQLFAGHTPMLQSLVTSSPQSWHPTMLTNLRVLDFWDCNAGLSIRSLLGILHCASRLEEINIVSPNPPLHDCPPGKVAYLPYLKKLKVKNPDFYTIVGFLSTSNVQIATISSIYNHHPLGVEVAPAFKTLHPFVGLLSMTPPLPVLNQSIVLASLVVDHTTSGFVFMISIVTETNKALYIDLEWTGGSSIVSWIGYIQRSISALAEMRFLSGALLQIMVPKYGFSIDYTNPLFRLRAIEHLTIEGAKVQTLLEVLASSHTPLLPNLKLLSIPEDDLTEKDIQQIPKLLQLRKGLIVALSPDNHENLIRLLSCTCVIEGELASLDTILHLIEPSVHRAYDYDTYPTVLPFVTHPSQRLISPFLRILVPLDATA